MTSFQDYINRQLCSPWGRPQFSDTLLMQYLLETYTDKSLSGDFSGVAEESSKELCLTTQRWKMLNTVRPIKTYAKLMGVSDGIEPFVSNSSRVTSDFD